MGNINRVSTDMCMMDYYPSEEMRQYGDEAYDNYVVWNFKQRLGENVDILSISVVYIVSWKEIDILGKIPRKVMYLCTYCENE